MVTPQVRYQLPEIASPFAVQLPAGTDEHPGNEPSRTCGLEHLRGSALGFRNLTNYIARSLLETGGFRPDYTLHW